MKIAFWAVAVLNVLGLVCLVWFAVPFVLHDTAVPNPDAMIPMTRWEGGGMALTVGLLPLLAANALAFVFAKGIGWKRAARLLFFLPGAVCAVLVALYWIGSFTWWAT